MDLLKANMKRRASAVAIALAFGALIIASSPACSGPKCSSGDIECLLDNIVIVQPENDGKRLNLKSMSGSKLPAPVAKADGGASKPDGGGSTTPTPPVPSCGDTSSDPNNCGGCGSHCPSGQPCVSGQCGGCPPGDAWCPGTGCTFTGGDVKNCGGCGKACDPRQICDGALCQCPGSNPNCMAGDPPGGAGAPSITQKPNSVHYPDPQTLEPMNIGFDDPNKCQPAFCARLCRGSTCTARTVCVPPMRDGKLTGVWRSYLGFLAEPAADANFTLGFTPISAPGCPEDLIDKMIAGEITPNIGLEAEIAVTITGAGISSSPSSSTSSSGGSSSGGSSSGGSSSGVPGGTQCSPAVATCSCSIRSCSNGSSCWYERNGSRVSCTSCGNGCNAAAQSIVNGCCPKP